MALGCLARAMGPVLPGVSSARSALLLRAPRPLHSGVFAKAQGGAAAAAAGAAQPAAAGKKGGGKKGAAKEEGAEGPSGPYSPTVKLPTTDFSLRANSPVREPQIQAWWEEQAVYSSLAEGGQGEPYTLHDGPPYANGDLHIGHALNKILKDFINRYQLLQGRRAKFVPGWDTHGLPIELKVLQSLPDKERKSLGVLELRAKAREFALKTIDAQRAAFKRYGVWGDWSSPYVTLEPAYEAAQLRVFGKMYTNGHIYRGLKPVHWSPSSRTALAEAELEYPEGHKSPSIYVALPMTAAGPQAAEVPGLVEALQGAAFAIWTTTPWTIPANLAVALNDQLEYCVVEVVEAEAEGEGAEAAAGWAVRRLVVAKELVGRLAEKTGASFKVLATVKGSALEGCTYKHPLYDRISPVVIGGDYITTETGTGLVHTAPGHGQEDYQVGQRCGLPLLSPVDDAGCFTAEAGERFAGLAVQGEGNKAVTAALREAGALLKEELYEHKYPYDWRTKKPTIFRATSQWFASVEGFRGAALEAIRGVGWVPGGGLNRITGMVEGRSDWCISRQRKWGVPIPVFYDTETDEALMSDETIAHITALVAQHGSDCWWTLGVEELLPPSMKHLAPRLRKGEDTMDVWFDSGSSWAGVLQATPGLAYPADLYLEGSDQHRGWFQSSLLTSVAANGVAPYKAVLTHGFVLDEKGQKMSKSLGNVVDPRVVIEGGKDAKAQPAFGADVLRLWVASVDYTSDVAIGSNIIKQMADMYRKVRGTLRFLLGNLADYDPAAHAVPYAQLPGLDRYVLGRLHGLMTEVAAAYDNYQFFKVFQALQRFVVVDLSNFYLDTAKDRLYIRGPADPARRACQTVLDALLRGLLAALAPLVPHMAEDAWLNLPYARPAASVFQAGWAAPDPAWATGLTAAEAAGWAVLLEVRDAANGVLEKARSGKAIGAGLEARVVVHVSEPAAAAALAALAAAGNGADELRYLLIVSQVELVSDVAAVKLCPFHDTLASAAGAGAISVGVMRASGTKCARCWNYSEAVGQAAPADYPDLCERCTPVVAAAAFKPQQQAAAPGGAKQPAVAGV
ncbi:hypothetical protein HYH02_007767 [Chlamydomonas schloesseri]|uniref:isoleucine--tRNA ligase n=1 Tax=Chlamydomonas schloesseri TaxID=2026947 RepID=A0A836B4L5_9CHLO|nr:hypothetical protein HYH02_007767 [Chlamydomonas schloesseri]|eukprot:KAG2447442.1 hypothetical protein HYH02_007767 [Chlamydomonas schloesseri]